MSNLAFIAKQLDGMSEDIRALLADLDERDRQAAVNMIKQGHKDATVIYCMRNKPQTANIEHVDPYADIKRGD